MKSDSVQYKNAISANHGPIETQVNHMKQKVINNYASPPPATEIPLLFDIVPPRELVVIPRVTLKELEKQLNTALEYLYKLKDLPPDILQDHYENHRRLVGRVANLKRTCTGWGTLPSWNKVIVAARDVRKLFKNIHTSSIRAKNDELQRRFNDDSPEEFDPPTPKADSFRGQDTTFLSSASASAPETLPCCQCNCVHPMLHCRPASAPAIADWLPLDPCLHSWPGYDGNWTGYDAKAICVNYIPP